MKLPVDFCVAVSGDNVDLYVPAFFETLFRTNNLEDVTVHVILKGQDQRVTDYVSALRCPTRLKVHSVPATFPIPHGPKRTMVSSFGNDAAVTCEYMAEQCGDAPWVIVSHLDVLYRGDFVSYLRSWFMEENGMVGEHRCGVCAFQREAYEQSPVGFRIVSGLIATPHGQSEQYMYNLRYGDDPRCTDRSKRVYGMDVMQLFELAIQQYGWRYIWLDDGIRNHYYWHFMQGSNYNHNEQAGHMHQQWLNQQLNTLGIQKIQ